MLSHALLALALAASGDGLGDEHAKREKGVLKELERPEIWRDQNEKEKLLSTLAEAKILRSPRIAAKIIKHIHYDTQDKLVASPPRLTVQERYPVYGVLYETGIPVVPLLVERIRSIDKNSPDYALVL